MRINRKRIKQSELFLAPDVQRLDNCSIVITYSSAKVSDLHNCLYYLSLCAGIEKCEIVLVLYENEYFETDFSVYKLNISHYWSKRNNPDNYFCLSHARNIGLYNAKYDWVLMMDCDVLVPSHLCSVILSNKIISNTNYIYSCHRYNIEAINKDLMLTEHKAISKDDSFCGFWHYFNRKLAIEQVGGYGELLCCWGAEDCCFIFRMAKCGSKLIYIDKYINVYHVQHGVNLENWNVPGANERNWKILRSNTQIKFENCGKII